MKQLVSFFLLSLMSTVVLAQIFPEGANPSVSQSQTLVKSTKKPAKKYYATGVLGATVYPEVSNIDRGYNFSAGMGYYLKEVVMLELGLGVAKSQMTTKNLLFNNQRDTFNIDQYQLIAAAKYPLEAIAGTNFTPILGLALSYTMRSYNLLNGLTNNSGKTGSSTAFDAGVGTGVDYIFNAKYAAGLDFKYMFNLSNQVSSNYANPTFGYTGIAVESLQYYVAGISARMNF
ncbi:MAG: outer membrane beta-barrel protein [Bdellovibrionota bacterium]